MSFGLILVHVGIGAVWLGSMTYSLFVVQPRIARVVPDPARAEEFYRELGAGNRWRVIGLITALFVTGVGLAVIQGAQGAQGAESVQSGLSWGWWLVVGLKAGLLVAASALFWWVSWRGWPRRVFALPTELPALQGRFRRVALAMTALVGLSFVLGVAAAHLL
jgi:hypothetical protein